MKNLKISFTALIALLIISIATGVFAHGSQVDSRNVITMPSTLSNGTGVVTTSESGNMSYQFVETTSAKYATIKKLEAIYNVIDQYIKAMNGESNTYEATLAQYQKDYNETANAIINTYGIKFDAEGRDAIKSLWVYELPTYNDSAWISASGKTMSLDLTTFEGTKYFVGWVKIGDVYDAEVYTAIGTKKDEPVQPEEPTTPENPEEPTKPEEPTTPEDPEEPTKPEEPTTPEDPEEPTKPEEPTTSENPEEPTKPEEPTTPQQPDNNNNSNNNNNSVVTGKQDPTTAQKVIPYTGTGSALLGMIAVAGTSAVVSYRKYRKIK